MIPAILSCVFVIYLYHELNRDESQAHSGPARGAGGHDDLLVFTQRVADLEGRLRRLARKSNTPEKRS